MRWLTLLILTMTGLMDLFRRRPVWAGAASSRLRDGLGLAGFDAHLSLSGFQPINASTSRVNVAASWNKKAWPASGKSSSFAPGTLPASCRALAATMN
jgi:hypothetical protein